MDSERPITLCVARYAVLAALLLCACSDHQSYGMRFDLFYGADLNQLGVSVRWGSSEVSSSQGNTLALETTFSNRDEAVAAQTPLHVLVGSEDVFSEVPRFSDCDSVSAFGVRVDDIRLARFSRAVDVDGHTVLDVSRENGRPALFCYTVPQVVAVGVPSTNDELEVILQLALPVARVGFQLDGRDLSPLAVGLDSDASTLRVMLRLNASLGSVDVGGLMAAVDGAGSGPFEVSTAACSPTFGAASNRLVQLSETVVWAGGELSVDMNEPLTCCYQNGDCTGIVP